MTRFPRTLRMILIVVALGCLVADAARAAANEATLHVTDNGANQMTRFVERGKQGIQWVMNDLPANAHLSIVMPMQREFDAISTEELTQRFTRDLKAQVDAGLRAGQTTFEIQLIEDIDLLQGRPGQPWFGSYFDAGRQKDADRFGAAAYGAIVEVNRYLEQKGVHVKNYAATGSNGTKVFAANIAHWKLDGRSIWEGVDFFDGRAYYTPILNAIRAIGATRVRIFNTRGDAWAPYFPFGMAAIGNVLTSVSIWKALPGVRVYLLEPLEGVPAHISGMTSYYKQAVSQFMGDAPGFVLVPGVFFGRDLQRPHELPPVDPSRDIPKELRESAAVWQRAAQDLVGALSSFADIFKELHGVDKNSTRMVMLIAHGAALRLAIQKDIEKSHGEPVVWLSSETLQEIGSISESLFDFGYEIYKHSPRADAKSLERIATYKKVFDAYKKALKTGDWSYGDKLSDEDFTKMNAQFIDAAKGWLKALYGTELRAELQPLQDELGQLEKQIELRQASLRAMKVDTAAARGRFNRELAQLVELGKTRDTKNAVLLEKLTEVSKAEKRFASRLMMLDAVPEFVAAILAHHAAGKLTMEVIDGYSDAFIMLSASVIVLGLEATPLAAYAPVIRDGIVAVSKYARDEGLREPMRALYLWWANPKRQFLEQYAAYEASQTARGLTVLPPSKLYPGLDYRALGFSAKEQAELEARHVIYSSSAEELPPMFYPDIDGAPQHSSPQKPVAAPTVSFDRDMAAEALKKVKPRRNDMRPGTLYQPPLPPPCIPASACLDPTLEPPPCKGTDCGGKPQLSASPPCPPACDDHPPGGGSTQGPSARAKPPASSTDPLGGVELNVAAQLLGDALPEIDSLVFDAASGRLMLVGKRSLAAPLLRESDLAMALWLVFGPHPQDAQFSLDAADPRNLQGPWLKAVYFPEEMRGTAFGESLFDADFSMKQLAFGVRISDTGKIEARPPFAPGFASVRDLLAREKDGGGDTHPQWSRYWIIVDEMLLQRSGDGIAFETARMGVESRWQTPDRSSRTGLKDVDTPQDAVETRWAKQLELRYGEAAQTMPEFARLLELAKAMALAKWLKQQNLEVDMDWVVSTLRAHGIAGTDRVTALSVSWKTQKRVEFNDQRGHVVRTTTHTLRLFGGVDLTVKPEFSRNSDRVPKVTAAVKAARAKYQNTPIFTVTLDGQKRYAKVLAINKSGQALWRSQPKSVMALAK